MLFSVAQIMISRPALSSIVVANFFTSFKLDPHSMGMGMKRRYISVATFDTKDTHMMGIEMPAWQTFPGSGLICQ